MASGRQQATARRARWRARRAHPGSQAQSSLNGECAVTVEIPIPARVVNAQSRTSLNRKNGTGGVGKSEAPILAMNPGNAGGVKGCQREITDQGYMARH